MPPSYKSDLCRRTLAHAGRGVQAEPTERWFTHHDRGVSSFHRFELQVEDGCFLQTSIPESGVVDENASIGVGVDVEVGFARSVGEAFHSDEADVVEDNFDTDMRKWLAIHSSSYTNIDPLLFQQVTSSLKRCMATCWLNSLNTLYHEHALLAMIAPLLCFCSVCSFL
jgi:hypothetical protein